MSVDEEPPIEIVPQGVSIVGRWGFLLDNLPEEIGGGYFAGEFLLRSDGALLSRPVIDETSGDSYRYKALGQWQVFHRFGPEADEAAVLGWLGSRNYEIRDPPDIPIDADVGPELSRSPAQASPSLWAVLFGWLRRRADP